MEGGGTVKKNTVQTPCKKVLKKGTAKSFATGCDVACCRCVMGGGGMRERGGGGGGGEGGRVVRSTLASI